MIQQVASSEWNGMFGFEFLCELPLSVKEITDSFKIEFKHSIEDGLGDCFSAIVKIANSLYLLKGYLDIHQKEIGICVYMPGNHPNPQSGLDDVITSFNIDSSELMSINDDLSAPQWILTRQGDDGNEVEMNRFLKEAIALSVMQKYTDRGHKQCYFVHKKND